MIWYCQSNQPGLYQQAIVLLKFSSIKLYVNRLG